MNQKSWILCIFIAFVLLVITCVFAYQEAHADEPEIINYHTQENVSYFLMLNLQEPPDHPLIEWHDDTHKLTMDCPDGYHLEGKIWDRLNGKRSSHCTDIHIFCIEPEVKTNAELKCFKDSP